MVTDQLPKLPHGDGSLGWDEARGKVTLRHIWPPGGKVHIERADTVEQCIARRDRRRRDVDLGPDRDTLEGVMDQWIAHQATGHAAKTVSTYRVSAAHMLRELQARPYLPDVTVTDVETMWASLVHRGLGQASLDKIAGHWSSFLSFALRRQHIEQAQYVGLRQARRPPAAHRPKPKANWYDLEDYTTVRAHLLAVPTARHLLLATMLLTGMRPGETVGLKREYLHPDHLDVEGAMLREGGEAGTWSTRLKTDHLHHFAHRRIPLVPELSAALSALVARHPGQEFVFIDDEGRTKGRPITEGMTEDIARDLSLNLGVRYVTPVGYRHTFASVCRHRGMPYEALAKLMGHANTTEIIRTYGHPVTDMAAPDLARFMA